MIVGRSYDAEEKMDDQEDAEQGRLYRLMRGYESEEEEDEVDFDDEEVDEQQSPVEPPTAAVYTQPLTMAEEKQDWGSPRAASPDGVSSSAISSSVAGRQSTYTEAELRSFESSWDSIKEKNRRRRKKEMKQGDKPVGRGMFTIGAPP
jgi:hypothetical protein